ncbi:helix-turn-helix domain-containing protein [Microbacterium sp. KR10-403]|uniref:helix-turn-helix domain-containing protein n=1 Tax=Microbacterium sp. KR10-403 TaxID=3158581 RepID=UPI0032E4995E
MDHAEYDRTVGTNVHEAILESGLSVRGAADRSGIPYTTLDRKLKGLSSFTVADLRRIGQITRRRADSFMPREPKPRPAKKVA